MPTDEQIRTWRGHDVVGEGGHRIGRIDDLYADDRTGRPTWALVGSGPGGRPAFVPVANARQVEGAVHVPFTRAAVEAAPDVAPDAHLTPADEEALLRHYGLDASDPGPGAGSPRGTGEGGRDRERSGGNGTADGAPAAVGGSDDAMTLSEEQVRVGTRELPGMKVRMRKVTVTENVTVDVPVTREEVRLEEVPADAPDDPEALPVDGEVTLRSEVPVVEKQTVDRERVRLGKEQVTEQVRVDETVRRETVDVEHRQD